MAALTVLLFRDPRAAEGALEALHGMERERRLRINDAATVSWPATAHAPRTRQATNLPAVGALDGAFWGMLFGLLFAAPFFGAAAGVAIGALAGRFADFGIDDALITAVRDRMDPGTSALFALTEDNAGEEIAGLLTDLGLAPESLAATLTGEQSAALQRAFGRG
jgi:uncharacterized membrane protein